MTIEHKPVTPFAVAYPAPWRIQGAEIADADGCHVNALDDDDPDELEFWRGIVEAVNRDAKAGEPAIKALDDAYIIELAVALSNYHEADDANRIQSGFEAFSHHRIVEFARALLAADARIRSAVPATSKPMEG